MASILKLEVRRFLGIEDLEIKPGKVTVITGGNEVGKTSIIEAIRQAFQSGGQQPALIHGGEDNAEILVDLGTMQIKRRITPTANRVQVKTDGMTVDAPQAFLNELVGSALSFKPVEFFLASAAEQRRMLLQAIPITVTDKELTEWFGSTLDVDTDQHGLEVLTAVEDAAYNRRHAAGAVRKEQQATIEVLAEKIPKDFDVETWRAADVSQIHAEIESAATARARRVELEEDVATSLYEVNVVKQRVQTVEAEIKRLENDLAEFKAEAARVADEGAAYQAQLDGITVPDASDAKAKLDDYTAAKAVLHDVDALEAVKAKLVETEATWQTWEGAVTLARAKPQELLDAANIPIEGLVVTADSITLDGVDIQHISGSQRIAFALQVVKALNPDFRVICIDGAEQLDAKNLEALLSQAEDDDWQYIITRVVADQDLQIETTPAETEQEEVAK